MSKGASLLLGLALGASAAGHEPISNAIARPLAATSFPFINATLQSRNSVSVNVYSGSRSPLNDVYVELLDDVNSTINRQRTTGSGRVVFNGLSIGRYKVRVLPYGTEYAEQVKDIEIVNYSMSPNGGSIDEQVDFYLRSREGLTTGPFAAPPGVVFAQDVPDAAKRMFDKGVQELRESKKKEGFESMRKAIEIFPTYYAALERLGTEYIMVAGATPAHYDAARILLIRALEVNRRGFPSTFGLGLAQYRLKMSNEAVDNLKRATTLHNQSVDAHLYLGMALNQAGKTAEAEASLKRASEIAKGRAAEVHFQLARFYSGQKRYNEAADELELYLKAKPSTPDAVKMKQTIQQLREKAAKK